MTSFIFSYVLWKNVCLDLLSIFQIELSAILLNIHISACDGDDDDDDSGGGDMPSLNMRVLIYYE